jgi:hypothetical protein
VATDNKAYHCRFRTSAHKLHHHSDVISITTGPAFNPVVMNWTLIITYLAYHPVVMKLDITVGQEYDQALTNSS